MSRHILSTRLEHASKALCIAATIRFAQTKLLASCAPRSHPIQAVTMMLHEAPTGYTVYLPARKTVGSAVTCSCCSHYCGCASVARPRLVPTVSKASLKLGPALSTSLTLRVSADASDAPPSAVCCLPPPPPPTEAVRSVAAAEPAVATTNAAPHPGGAAIAEPLPGASPIPVTTYGTPNLSAVDSVVGLSVTLAAKVTPVPAVPTGISGGSRRCSTYASYCRSCAARNTRNSAGKSAQSAASGMAEAGSPSRLLRLAGAAVDVLVPVPAAAADLPRPPSSCSNSRVGTAWWSRAVIRI